MAPMVIEGQETVLKKLSPICFAFRFRGLAKTGEGYEGFRARIRVRTRRTACSAVTPAGNEVTEQNNFLYAPHGATLVTLVIFNQVIGKANEIAKLTLYKTVSDFFKPSKTLEEYKNGNTNGTNLVPFVPKPFRIGMVSDGPEKRVLPNGHHQRGSTACGGSPVSGVFRRVDRVDRVDAEGCTS